MDTTSAIVFLAVALGVLLVVKYFDRIDRLMERTLSHKALLRGMDLRDILLAILGLILAGLGSALFVLRDWAISLSFALVAVVIIVLIMNLRHKSEHRQRWLNAQSMANLTALIESAVEKAVEKALDRERQKTHEANDMKPKRDDEKGDGQ